MLKEFLTNIAESIRTVLHTEEKINAQDFSSKIPEVYDAGYEKGLTEADPTIEPLTITENGTYTAPDGVDGYSPVTVEVESEGNGIDPNWTDWSYLFYNGARSESIEKLKFTDSHNVTNFNHLFYNNRELPTIPELDTSNGTDFSYMFGITSISTIPELDTSNGTNFESMFERCNDLTTVPELNLSKGTNFESMFANCGKLTSVPKLNTINGESLKGMFNSCSSLTGSLEIDTSNATNIYQMVRNCSKLISIPKLNMSKVTNCAGAFAYCSALVEIGFEGTFNIKANDTSFLTTAPNVNQESLHKMIDCMVKTGTAATYTIGIGSQNLARVSEEYVQKALDKGIKLQ